MFILRRISATRAIEISVMNMSSRNRSYYFSYSRVAGGSSPIFQGISNGLLAVEFEMYDPGKVVVSNVFMVVRLVDRFFPPELVYKMRKKNRKFVLNLSRSSFSQIGLLFEKSSILFVLKKIIKR